MIPRPPPAGLHFPYFIFVVASVALALTQLTYGHGWPLSHEGTAWLQRLNVVRHGLENGDLFPIWWNEGGCGLGSPMPLLYHKLFNIIAAPLIILTGAVKGSVLVTLAALSGFGIYGLRALCANTARPGIPASALALTFPHLSYAVTDWLVRGAFAEYAGMVVGVWLLAWCVGLLRSGRVTLSIVPLLVLSFLAHSVIALYALMFVALAVVILVFLPNTATVREIRRLAVAAAGCVALLSPLLGLMAVVSGRANTGYLADGVYHPTRQYWDLARYVWDETYVWGADWKSYTVQLDLPLLASAAAAGALLVSQFVRRSPAAAAGDGAASATYRGLIFVVLSLALIAFLQSRASSAFYEHVPGAALIQFPWRLLSYATPLLVALVVWLHDRVDQIFGRRGTVAAVATAAFALVTSPALRPIRYEWLPPDVLTTSRMPPNFEWREYWPGRADRTAQVEAYLRDLTHLGVVDVDRRLCLGSEQHSDDYLVRRYVVRCTGRSTVALPVASYGLTTVERGGATAARVEVLQERGDPRVRVRLGAGDHVLRVQLPTLWRIARTTLGLGG